MAMSLLVALSVPAWAADKAQLFVTAEQGFGRMILSFPGLYEMPPHQVKVDNGVLAVTFSEPIDIVLPDVTKILPDYISVARVDPDGRGVRFALRTKLNFNPMEAGEKLFLDLMPPTWQGMPPALPPEIVADLARRARNARRADRDLRPARRPGPLHLRAVHERDLRFPTARGGGLGAAGGCRHGPDAPAGGREAHRAAPWLVQGARRLVSV